MIPGQVSCKCDCYKHHNTITVLELPPTNMNLMSLLSSLLPSPIQIPHQKESVILWTNEERNRPQAIHINHRLWQLDPRHEVCAELAGGYPSARSVGIRSYLSGQFGWMSVSAWGVGASARGSTVTANELWHHETAQ